MFTNMDLIKNYKDLKTGDVLHRYVPFLWYKPKTYIALAIRKFTKCWASHTAMILEVWGQIMVVESDNGKVQIMSFETWVKNCEITVSRYPFLNDLFIKSLSLNALSKQGSTFYDYESTLVDHFIYKETGVWIGKKDLLAERKMNCSEYIAWCFNKTLDFYPNWFKILPVELYNDNRFVHIWTGVAKDLI